MRRGEVNKAFVMALALLSGGRLRGLGVTALKCSAHLPDLPTVAEASGLSEYERIVTFGVHGPPPGCRARS